MDDAQLRCDFSASSKRAAQRFGEDAVYPQWTALIDALCPAVTSEEPATANAKPKGGEA